MKYSLIISNSAFYDLEDAIGYYESKLKGLGKRMEVDFWKSVDLIEKRPLLSRMRYKQYRQSMLNKFPYAIVYEVLNEKIIIYKVVHLKVRPKKRYKI